MPEPTHAAPVNILLVDDQPAKLTTYEVILQELGETLLKANSAQAALEVLLKNDVAVILVDVCMPDLDGFELARMIRDHPRFKDTAIIFISAINVSEIDSLKGYELGGVDYVPVPVVPGVLRGKVRVFVDLYRKTRALAAMNDELERRVAERTAQLEASIAHQELLAREVDHRARNALAVIQSIVSLTPAQDAAQYGEAIRGRIRAMATAHNLLSASRWRGADLLSLAQEELAPYAEGGRVRISGGPIEITANVAQNLALILHELATNAAKYGALSSETGRLHLSWGVSGEMMEVDWREEGAAGIVAPEKKGFGARVVEASVAQFGGVIARDWCEDGLKCRISLPAAHFLAARAPAVPPAPPQADVDLECIKSRPILVLEDEPMIALMTAHMIRDLKGLVRGPFASVEQARGALDASLAAALLDVNVAGEMVYEFAAELKAWEIPFIFMTGYQADALDARFAQAPVLTKPVAPEELAWALSKLLRDTSVRRSARA